MVSHDPSRRLYTQHQGDITIVISGEGRWVVGTGSAFPVFSGEIRTPPEGAVFFRHDLDSWYTWDTATQAWIVSGGGGSGITQLTGDVTAGPGSGSQAATIANDAVTNVKLRNSAAGSVIGRATGASAGDPADIVAAFDKDVLGVTGGDIGSGGSLAFITLTVAHILSLQTALDERDALSWYLGAR